MKKVKFQVIQPDVGGPTFGQVLRAADHVNAQTYAHDHIEAIVRDWINGGCQSTLVAGFDLSLLGGLQVRLLAPGHIITPDGKSFELIGDGPFDFTLADADEDHPRIDLIVGLKEADVDSADEFRPFVQLRTQAELEAGVAPYPPSQFNQPTEEHTRITLSVKQGVAGADPVAPALAANEIALYSITVKAAATELQTDDVTDLRNRIDSLCVLYDRLNQLADVFNNQSPNAHRHGAIEVDIGPGAGVWVGKTVQAFINASALGDEDEIDPLTMPEVHTPTGKIGAVAAVEGATPVIDIPKETKVIFDKKVIVLEPQIFPSELNPRYVNKAVGAGTEADNNTQALSLAVINSLVTDGGGDWVKQLPVLPSARQTWPAGHFAAARDDRFIEIMGGRPSGGTSWYEFDGGTLTQKNFVGVAPNVPVDKIVFITTMGNGFMLVATQKLDGGLEWFKVDADAGTSTKLTGGGVPVTATPTIVWGELIQAGVIFLMISSTANPYWTYNVGANTWENVATTGQGPKDFEDGVLGLASAVMDVCLYTAGKAVVFASHFGPNSNAGNLTFVFEFATLTWTKLNIAPALPLLFSGRLSMTNINGRPQLVTVANGNENGSTIYELTPSLTPAWRSFVASLPSRIAPSACSLLSGGLPSGTGYFFGGATKASVLKTDIWKFVAGGVIETLFNGETALTLGPGTTQATFRIPDFGLDWEVAKYLANLGGDIPPGTVKIRVSFDGGVSFQEVIRDKVATIADSSNPATRILEITMFSAGSTAPKLTTVIEHFEQVGGSAGLTEVVLRVDCPSTGNGVFGWFLSREAVITCEDRVETNTPSRCMLVRTQHDGPGNPPIIRQYLSRRDVTITYTGGPKAGGVDPTFLNDLAVMPNHITARRIVGGATGAVNQIADPNFVLDANVTVLGLANGDHYEVEVRVGYSYFPQIAVV